MEQANFAELRDKVNSWDIQAEELLIQKIKLFTIKYNEDFQLLCKNFDNFSNSVSSTEVDHLKAINELKNLSNQRFIEQSLEKSEPSQPVNQQNEGVLMDETEKIKQSIELSMKFIETISKKNKKEVIEDDGASVQSSRMTMEKNTKGVKLPYIMGTEMFNGDKAIGLDVAPEEEEREDEDQNELTKDLVVDAKQKKLWDKAEEKRKKKIEKELKKKQKNQNKNQKQDEEEEPEVKVPIENEEEPKQENQDNQSSSEIKIVAKTGGSVPPPPPPPPPPPVLTAPVKPAPKPKVENPVPVPEIKIENQPNPAIQTNKENQEQNAIQLEQIEQPPQPKPPVKEPLSFQEQLRNRFKTSAGNKNPLAPVTQDKNIIVTPQNVKLNNFLENNLEDDEDDDIGDIKNSLFRKNPVLVNPNNNLMNQPQPNQNGLQNQKPNLFSGSKIQNNQEENASEEKKKLTESQFIQITKNENLDNARKKMKNLFGSDDEDEDGPKNIVDKTKDLTNKLNNIGITSNPKNEPKKEEPKPLPKKTFFDDDDDEDDIKIKKEEKKIETNINNQQEQNSKPEINKEDNNNNDNKEESKINKVQTQTNPHSFLEGLKGKLAQRNEALTKKEEPKKEEPKKEEPKKEEIIKEEPKIPEVKKEEEKKEESKILEPKKEEPKIPEIKKEEAKKEEPEKPIKRSTTMKTNLNSNMNKRFSEMQNMLASKMGKGMMFGQSKPPKPQEEKIEHNAPADKGEPTYEEVIKTAAKKVVKRKKPKRVGTFGIGEGRIEVPKEPPKEVNEIKEVKEEHEEDKNEEPKNEVNDEPIKIDQIKEVHENEESKPELNEPSPPKPQVEQKKVPDIKNSVFNLFTDKDDEQKKPSLFDKVEFDTNPPENNNNQEQKPNINLNFLNNGNGEVQKSKLFFLEDDDDKPSENNNNIENINTNKKPEPNKKKLAFFDDDE